MFIYIYKVVPRDHGSCHEKHTFQEVQYLENQIFSEPLVESVTQSWNQLVSYWTPRNFFFFLRSLSGGSLRLD